MALLAQINFKETLQLNSFPATGILQFSIANSSHTYSAFFEKPLQQDDFRIIYFAKVIEDEEYLTTDFAFLPTETYIPVAQPSSLGFSLKYASMPISDHRFEKTILNITAKKYELFLDYKSVYEAYERLFPSEGHKLGGYPYFT